MVQDDNTAIHSTSHQQGRLAGVTGSTGHLLSHHYPPNLLEYPSFRDRYQQFQYKALLFGISSIARVLTKTMVVVAANLPTQGVVFFPYINDWLVVALSELMLRDHIQTI